MDKTGLLVCQECWDADHPQNHLGREPVNDPQALRNPRPDSGLTASRSTDGINLSYDFTTASTSSHTRVITTYYSVNNFVYRINAVGNSASSMTWDPDGLYVTLSDNVTTGSSNKYQILTLWDDYAGSGAEVDIDPSKYKEVQVRIRKSGNSSPSLNSTEAEEGKRWNGAPGYGGSFWFQTKEPTAAMGTDNSLCPEPEWNTGIGGWNILTFNLSNNSKWTGAGKVDAFEFRLYGYYGPSAGWNSESTLDSYDLSWIKFIPY